MQRDMRPINLERIEDGKMLRDFDRELKNAIDALIGYHLDNGMDAKGAKAEIACKITIAIETGEEIYTMKSAIVSKIPQRPVKETLVIAGEDELGEWCLFARDEDNAGDDDSQHVLRFAEGGE